MSLSLADRAPIYAWLALLLAREVDAPSWAALSRPPVRDFLVDREPKLGALLDATSEADPETTHPELERLREEFARLFLVPGGVSPRVSSWLDTEGEEERERVGRDLAGFVARGFEALGRAPRRAEPWGRLPLDHVAMVFELAAQAGASPDPADRELAERVDKALLTGWPRVFGATLADRAAHPFYRALGRSIEALHAPTLRR